jgi:hypothetical protein
LLIFGKGESVYYSNARWYDPTLGRFITEDPARDGVNWYGYCAQNPLRFVDPSGLEHGIPSDVQPVLDSNNGTVPLGLDVTERNSAADARGMENKAQTNIEIDRAYQLADTGAVYGYNESLAGTVVPMNLDQYDCISELSAVTGTPLLSTESLANPAVREQYFSDVPLEQRQAGDWILVRATLPGETTTTGHVQMITGTNQYADSIPATGPRTTAGNPVDNYLTTQGANITTNVTIRPRR